MLGEVYMTPQTRALAKSLCVGWEISFPDALNLQCPALHPAHRMHHN